jgi:hypothetical protein
MNREEIIRMAREAGGRQVGMYFDMDVFMVERFAALVSEAEREACIKALEDNEQFYCRDTLRARGEA